MSRVNTLSSISSTLVKTIFSIIVIVNVTANTTRERARRSRASSDAKRMQLASRTDSTPTGLFCEQRSSRVYAARTVGVYCKSPCISG